jgi:hypothetical protein
LPACQVSGCDNRATFGYTPFMHDTQYPSTTWHYRLLWLIALTSLLLNLALISVLLNYRSQLQAGATSLTNALDAVDLNDIELEVIIDETIPISLTIPFSDSFSVPIRETIPVATTILFEDLIEVPIDAVIPIDTDFVVQVDIPLVGRTGIPIPIVTTIPVSLTVEVPISRLIPIETDIEVDFLVEVPIESEIPVNTQLPVQLNVPVTISLEELGLDQLINQLREALRQLEGANLSEPD